MLEGMDPLPEERAKLLLIDTCAEPAGVSLCVGRQVLEIRSLTSRGASGEIVAAVRGLLQAAGWRLAELDGVGVVRGPGSFTGVRAGLATAKGLCEAGELKLAAVSRLEVLAEAAAADVARERGELREPELAAVRLELAVLDAGRGELYVREQLAGKTAREWVCAVEELQAVAVGRTVVVAEERVAERLAGSLVAMRPLTVGDALGPVTRCLRDGGSDAATVDANYVRGEENIYRQHASAQTRAPETPDARPCTTRCTGR